MSDTHQEFYDEQSIKKKDIVGDVLLLAGDLTAGSSSIDYIRDLGVPGYYILGNHEFYKRHWKECIREYQSRFDNTNILFMECDTAVHKNVRIIAATLWTDFMAPIKDKPFYIGDKNIVGEEVYIENQAFFCKEMMSDFYLIKGITISGWLERYKNSVDYLKTVLSEKHDGPTIVMTHHAPSFKSSHPRWEGSAIKGGFCSDLEYLIEEFEPELWVHGHCHEAFDYYIGKTRIICNPKGYPTEKDNEFKPSLVVEL